jgi:superfamily II DNA helicase RecQ
MAHPGAGRFRARRAQGRGHAAAARALGGPARQGGARPSRSGDRPPPLPLDDAALLRFAALKAWRGEVARSTTCRPTWSSTTPRWRDGAQLPATLDALGGISGVGAKKLEAYGQEILRVLGSRAVPRGDGANTEMPTEPEWLDAPPPAWQD